MRDKPTIKMRLFYYQNRWRWFWKPAVNKNVANLWHKLPLMPKVRLHPWFTIPKVVRKRQVVALLWTVVLVVIPNTALSVTPAIGSVFDPTANQKLVASDSTVMYDRGGIYQPHLIYPVGHVSIASAFGWRVAPCTGCSSDHTGTDFHVPAGTEIHAAMTGTVVFTGWSGSYGYLIVIDDGYGYVTYYAHMIDGSIPAQFVLGSHVNIGDVVGLVGCTGACTGAHLHFGLQVDGSFVDPLPVLQRYAP